MEALNRRNCETAKRFEHKALKNNDQTPLRARRNGKTKLWKRKPENFSIPAKYGMYEYFYINQSNCDDWVVVG